MKSSLESLERIIADARDRLLVRGVLNGDGKAAAALVSFHRRRVTAMGMSFFKSAADADDFAQDVFVRAFRSLGSFRGESSFSTWLTRIAYNMAVTAKRRRRDYLPLADEESIVSETTTPEEDEIREATRHAVREAVRELPERYAVCIELYFFYDNSYEEISRITGEQLNTIKSHIFRAKKILREKLREFYER